MFIYKAINKVNNKVYIGKTNNFARRINQHMSAAKRTNNNFHFYNALNGNPIDFSWEIIEECSVETVNDREKFWIQQYKSNEKEFGYNCTTGGDGGDTTSNHPYKGEIYRKISESLVGRKRGTNIYKMFIEKHGKELGEERWKEYRKYMGQRVSSSVVGKPKSPSHVANFSKKLKGVPQSDLAKQRKTKEGRIVSPHVVDQIKTLYLNGESINFIRHSVGYSHKKVKKTLKENGLL